MMRWCTAAAVAFILGFSGSCSTEPADRFPKPADLIPEAVYIDILAGSQVIEAYEAAYGDSLKTDSLKKALLTRHAVSELQLRTSHDYYRRDVVRQRKRLEEAVKRLEAESERIQVAVSGAAVPSQGAQSEESRRVGF